MSLSRPAGRALYVLLFSYAAGLALYGLNLRFFFWGATGWLIWGLFVRLVLGDGVGARGVFLCLSVFLSAGFRLWWSEPERDAAHLVNAGCGEGLYKVRLTEDLRERTKTFRAEASLAAVWRDSVWRECRGGIYLYFPKGEFEREVTDVRGRERSGGAAGTIPLPSYGDVIYFKGELKPIEGFVGDDGKYFDYAAFMAKRGVYGQCFLRSGSYRCEPWQSRGPWDFVRKKTLSLRGRLAVFFDSCGMEPREAAVAKALVLGMKTDDPVQQAYRESGIVHILAVSGMHLGIFAVMAGYLFFFLRRRRGLRYLQFVLVNVSVWGYALLTGMSPSVSRAACMFTFVSLGQCLGRQVPTERSLAVSALVLLAVRPCWLWEMGFLLSYSAVLGLVFLSPLLARVWRPRRRLPGIAWGLVVSSCAAQLATLPVILHTFGTFPTYFLLANLLVTPIVNVALPLGIVTAVTACVWTGGGLLLSRLLALLIRSMNGIALWIGARPAALLHISLSLCSAVLFYLTVLYLYRALKLKNRGGLPVALTLVCLVVLIG